MDQPSAHIAGRCLHRDGRQGSCDVLCNTGSAQSIETERCATTYRHAARRGDSVRRFSGRAGEIGTRASNCRMCGTGWRSIVGQRDAIRRKRHAHKPMLRNCRLLCKTQSGNKLIVKAAFVKRIFLKKPRQHRHRHYAHDDHHCD